jgi:hypothetical protein
MHTPAQVIGQNVKRLREHRMTAEVFGARIGEIFGKPWPRQTVYMLEQGQRRLAAEEVVAIAFLLDVSIADLFVPAADVDEVQVGRWRLPRERLLTQGQKDSEQLYEVARHAQALHRSIPEFFHLLRAQQLVIGDIDNALRGEPPWSPPEPSDDPALRGLHSTLRRQYERAQSWYQPE